VRVLGNTDLGGNCRNVFLGVSLYNQENFGESEAAYREAIAAEAAERERKGKKNENPLAWQGIVNLYDAQRKAGEYIDSALKLAAIYRDMYACFPHLGQKWRWPKWLKS
jgi:hypothetical protein